MKPSIRLWNYSRLRAITLVIAAVGLGGCPSMDIGNYLGDDSAAEIAANPEIPGLPVAAQIGQALIIGGATSAKTTTSADELYSEATNAFVATGSLHTSRAGIQAVNVGHNVLVPGGLSGSATVHGSLLTFTASVQSTTELFRNSTGAFQSTGSMFTKRAFYSATKLANGLVLIAGGFTGPSPTTTAELYNPKTGKFVHVGPMHSPRAVHSATLLADGTVLIVGGITDSVGNTLGTAELFHPNNNKFTLLASKLPSSLTLAGHTATVISHCACTRNGNVLIAAGFTGFSFGGNALETAGQTLVTYNPTTMTFSQTGLPSLVEDRMFHTASLIGGGKILIAGGIYGQGQFGGAKVNGVYGGVRNSAEIYDPKTNKVTCVGGVVAKQCAGKMTNSRAGHTATVLKSGKVLLAGGVGATTQTTQGKGAALNTAEVFIPAAGIFKATGKMHATHAFQAAVLIE